MIEKRRVAVVALALGLGLLITPALAGCNPAQIAQDAVENAVEDATGVQVDANGDGNVSMPDDWPAEIPVISGTLSMSSALGSGADTVWSVAVKTSDAQAAYNDATGKLKGAGYTSDFESNADGMSTGMFSNGKYSVGVTTSTDGSDQTLVYVVSVIPQ